MGGTEAQELLGDQEHPMGEEKLVSGGERREKRRMWLEGCCKREVGWKK